MQEVRKLKSDEKLNALFHSASGSLTQKLNWLLISWLRSLVRLESWAFTSCVIKGRAPEESPNGLVPLLTWHRTKLKELKTTMANHDHRILQPNLEEEEALRLVLPISKQEGIGLSGSVHERVEEVMLGNPEWGF